MVRNTGKFKRINKYMIYAGIDWSITSPAICVYDDERKNFCFENCEFYILNDIKNFKNTENVHISEHTPWKTPEHRYHNITNHFLSKLVKVDYIYMEGYSMGSKGKVFHIAENTEVLKYNLWLNKKEFELIPPTSLKKDATGKGNADKSMMYEAFKKIEKVNLYKILDIKEKKKVDSPISDIVDSYFLCRCAII